jgi:non-heme chloroperoxidase
MRRLTSSTISRPSSPAIGGEQLSSLGSRYPERVAGLIYLDAVWVFAFDNGTMTPQGEYLGLSQKLASADTPATAADRATFQTMRRFDAQQTSRVTIPEAEYHERGYITPDGQFEWRQPVSVIQARIAGEKKYTSLRVPILALCAYPQELGVAVDRSNAPAVRAAAERWRVLKRNDAAAFEKALPHARVVRLKAAHLIFISNEAEVLREIRAFISRLPP